jgi:hypothetical protein
MIRPAIIVVAFNRPHSLERLLSSIDKSTYPNGEVPLCICIDYQDSDANRAVVQIAEDFVWNFGPKEVIHQTENLGLKAHVLKCGDLTKRFGSIIMLEDDLYVSPAYYSYTVQAFEYYQNDEFVNGISLYNHRMNFSSKRTFIPLADGTDVYFLQIASSWGQAWTAKHWSKFRTWIETNPIVTQDVDIPDYVINWPDKSWLKHYIHYLSETQSFFVYPRISLSTNFGDKGQNNGKANTYFQSPLLESGDMSFRFTPVSEALPLYDAYFDLLPAVLGRLSPELKEYPFSNNLSGLKPLSKVKEKFVLIANRIEGAAVSFGMDLKPIESNVVHRIRGEEISLVETVKVKSYTFKNKPEQRKRKFQYYFGLIGYDKQLRNLMDSVLGKFLS